MNTGLGLSFSQGKVKNTHSKITLLNAREQEGKKWFNTTIKNV